MTALRVTGLDEYLEGGKSKLKLLIAGRGGSGKTRTASFAPRPVYASCENKMLSVADRNVPYMEIESDADMDAFLNMLEMEAKKPPARRNFETVIVDTVDAYESTLIAQWCRANKTTDFTGFEAWGFLDARMKNMTTRLFRLDFHLIFLVHTKEKKFEGRTPEDQVILKLKGSTGSHLDEGFDFVGMLETSFDLVDGERGLTRKIRWEPVPAAPWLKCCGGGLKETPVTFAASDFDAILGGIRAQLDGIKASSVLEGSDVPTHVAPEPTAPSLGGPVGDGTRRTAAKATSVAKAATPPARPSATPPAPAVVTPPPPAPRPEVEQPVTEEQAVANVQEVLGGKVIEVDGVPVDRTPAEAPAEIPSAGEPTTGVAEPDLPQEPAGSPEAQPDTSEVQEKEIPDDGDVAVACGEPRYSGTSPRDAFSVGCGKEMVVTLESGRIVGVNTDDRHELLDIAGLREQVFMCNPCSVIARNARKATA